MFRSFLEGIRLQSISLPSRDTLARQKRREDKEKSRQTAIADKARAAFELARGAPSLQAVSERLAVAVADGVFIKLAQEAYDSDRNGFEYDLGSYLEFNQDSSSQGPIFSKKYEAVNAIEKTDGFKALKKAAPGYIISISLYEIDDLWLRINQSSREKYKHMLGDTRIVLWVNGYWKPSRNGL